MNFIAWEHEIVAKPVKGSSLDRPRSETRRNLVRANHIILITELEHDIETSEKRTLIEYGMHDDQSVVIYASVEQIVELVGVALAMDADPDRDRPCVAMWDGNGEVVIVDMAPGWQFPKL